MANRNKKMFIGLEKLRVAFKIVFKLIFSFITILLYFIYNLKLVLHRLKIIHPHLLSHPHTHTHTL